MPRFGFQSRVDLGRGNFRFCQVRTLNTEQAQSIGPWRQLPGSRTLTRSPVLHLLPKAHAGPALTGLCCSVDTEQRSHVFLSVASNIQSFVSTAVSPHMHVIEHL